LSKDIKPIPTLTLPLKGRELICGFPLKGRVRKSVALLLNGTGILIFLPLQGGD